MAKNRDLELLYELGSLRFIERAWKQFLGPDFANLAEHHLRVAWIALILAKMEKKVDEGKILKMALVHDVSESRAGDLHHISRQYAKRDELKAIKDVFENTSMQKEMTALWQEYEAKKSLEAQIVKDADYLDVDLEIQEQKAMGRKHFGSWESHRKIIYKKFYTKSAKMLWQAIQKSKVSTWYDIARSRYTEGDMKPKSLRNTKKTKYEIS